MRLIPNSILVSCAGILIGCAPVSPESRISDADAAPASWSTTRQAKAGIDDRWVRKLGGAELEQLVAEAQRYNPTVAASAARIEQAVALAKIAASERQPGFYGAANANREEQAFIGFPGGGSSSLTNRYGVSLQSTWELDLWGRLKANTEAYIADAEAQVQADRALRASLAAQTAKAWTALAEANEQLALAERAVQARQESMTLIRERYERAVADDGGSAAQVRLSETELANAKSEVQRRQGSKQQVLRQLELLLGRYPGGTIANHATMPKLPGPVRAGLPSELLLRRPDILEAERRLAAAGRRQKSAFLTLFPSISLTGSLGTATDQLSQLLSSSSGVWALGGSLVQPIYQAGRLQAGVEQATAAEREAVANLQQVVLNAFGEVEQALVAEISLRGQVKELEQSVHFSRDASERANEEFRNGNGGVLTFLASQNQEIAAASALATARQLLLTNRINLHLALGGDVVLHTP